MKILMVLTSNDRMGDADQPTGFWLEEFAAPYYRFVDAGAEVTIASPKGGQPPVDPMSQTDDAATDATRRLDRDDAARAALAATRPLSEATADAHDAVFFPGGHGPLWDLAEDAAARRLIEGFLRLGKPVAAVCHGPAVFRHVLGEDGRSILAGRRATAFADSEEAAVGLTETVPFSVERMIRDAGGDYVKAGDFQPLAVADGQLITGQNPASSEATADRLLDAVRAAPTPTSAKAAEPYP